MSDTFSTLGSEFVSSHSWLQPSSSKSYHSQLNPRTSGTTIHGSTSLPSVSSAKCGQALTARPRPPPREPSTVTDSRCNPSLSGESGGRKAVPLVTQLISFAARSEFPPLSSSQNPNASGFDENHAAPRSAATSWSIANSP